MKITFCTDFYYNTAFFFSKAAQLNIKSVSEIFATNLKVVMVVPCHMWLIEKKNHDHLKVGHKDFTFVVFARL